MEKTNKTHISIRNVFSGYVLKGYQLLMPFVLRTIIIKVLGMDYVGLNSLFVSILQVLNIAELGVSFAMVNRMYKPVAEKDTNKICALLGLYRNYYRIIGAVIWFAGVFLTPFLPYLIKGSVPQDINLYTVYYLNLVATVLSYWLFSYRASLFFAHQRNDIISKITILTDTIRYSFQIVLLFLTKNYYSYLILIIIFQIVNNIFSAVVSKKMYPNYKPYGYISLEEKQSINSSIKDLFFGKIGMVVTASVDVIVISAFLGLIPLAIYQNYYYILSAVMSIFTIFFVSCRAAIGTNCLEKPMDKNYNDLKTITYIVFAALSFCMSCLLSMFQPFMVVWVGRESLLDIVCVVLFVFYLLVYELSSLFAAYKDALGKWHADRFRPLLTAIVNLTINLVLVNIIGIYGIIISTLVAYIFVDIPWIYQRLFKDVFEEKYKKAYTIYVLRLMLISLLISSVCFCVSLFVRIENNYLSLLINFSQSLLLSVLLYLLLTFKDSNLKRCLSIMFKRRIRRG